jgi:hypothetical protein
VRAPCAAVWGVLLGGLVSLDLAEAAVGPPAADAFGATLDGDDHWLSHTHTRVRMLQELDGFLATSLGK